MVALAFDVRHSDLPMRAAFPLLISNALGWLGAPTAPDAASLRTGRSLRVMLPEGGPHPADAAVTDPRGVTRTVAAQAGAIEIPIAHPGFYRVAAPSGPTRTLAANLADSTEADLKPAAHLTVAGKTLQPPDPPVRRPRRPIWWWALIAAAALSLAEWWTYHRRWTV
jgi:hypothetical protein